MATDIAEVVRDPDLSFTKLVEALSNLCEKPPSEFNSDEVLFGLLRLESELTAPMLNRLRQMCEEAIGRLPDGDVRKLHFHRLKNIMFRMQQLGPGILARFANFSFNV